MKITIIIIAYIIIEKLIIKEEIKKNIELFYELHNKEIKREIEKREK